MNYLPDQEKCKVAIIGMGYVGLPLAIEFAKKKNAEIVNELRNDIIYKFENKNESNTLEPNIDDLLVSIDKKLDKKQ